MKKFFSIPPSVAPLSFLKIDRITTILFFTIFFIATGILCFNYYYWHYSLVNYFLADALSIVFFGVLFSLGCFHILGPQSKITQTLAYITSYFLIVALVMYATTAIQLTPFEPVDEYLFQADLFLFYNGETALHTLYQHPFLVKCLYKAYNAITYEVIFLPILLIFLRQFLAIKQYFFYVLSTMFIGFFIYFFWPSMAPASIMHSPHFLLDQYNTGQKFYEIHHHLVPHSRLGGLISMPSFHVIWVILCQQSTWSLRWLWVLLLPLNVLIAAGALLLGWHYLVDLLVSGLICGLVWWVARVVNK
jgi:hypothetical protein